MTGEALPLDPEGKYLSDENRQRLTQLLAQNKIANPLVLLRATGTDAQRSYVRELFYGFLQLRSYEESVDWPTQLPVETNPNGEKPILWVDVIPLYPGDFTETDVGIVLFARVTAMSAREQQPHSCPASPPPGSCVVESPTDPLPVKTETWRDRPSLL